MKRQAGTASENTNPPQFTNSPTGTAFAVNPVATSVVTLIDATWEQVTLTDSVRLLSLPARLARLFVSDP